jgi:hypothetical protein
MCKVGPVRHLVCRNVSTNIGHVYTTRLQPKDSNNLVSSCVQKEKLSFAYVQIFNDVDIRPYVKGVNFELDKITRYTIISNNLLSYNKIYYSNADNLIKLNNFGSSKCVNIASYKDLALSSIMKYGGLEKFDKIISDIIMINNYENIKKAGEILLNDLQVKGAVKHREEVHFKLCSLRQMTLDKDELNELNTLIANIDKIIP